MNRLLENTNSPRDHPRRGQKFYSIEPRKDGLVDVYLAPFVCVYNTGLGVREYDMTVRVVRGIEPWPGLEDDIRSRYNAWCESGEVIDL